MRLLEPLLYRARPVRGSACTSVRIESGSVVPSATGVPVPAGGAHGAHDAARSGADARGRRVAALAALLLAAAAPAAPPAVLPDLQHGQPSDWVNSAPLNAAALRGRAVLVEFWAFACSNCLATAPWMKSIAARYREQGLVVIGVHTPELASEHDPRAVRSAVTRLGIDYPVMLDADYGFWRALDNHYWPALYLFGTDGRLVARAIGEMHAGEPSAQAFEARIAASLPARVGGADGRPAAGR